MLFVYGGPASSGGTVPLQALSGFFRFNSQFEPLAQIVDGNRALLYFDGQLDAGLGRSLIVIGVELVIWVIIGVIVTTWYDRKVFQRMSPEAVVHANRSLDEYEALRADEVNRSVRSEVSTERQVNAN